MNRRLYGPHIRAVENSTYGCDISYFVFKLQQFAYEYAQTSPNIKYLICKSTHSGTLEGTTCCSFDCHEENSFSKL